MDFRTRPIWPAAPGRHNAIRKSPTMMRLKRISLLHEHITSVNAYPFNVPSIASLKSLEISSRVCFFVGENGTGKSTLLEAIAAHYGFGLEGGNRSFSPNTTTSVGSIDPLVTALRLSFTKRTGGGFYLRAESFFNVASSVDRMGASNSYGGRSLHDQSHGESFLSLLQNRFTRSGFYIMDEPEAALSPQRQLSFLVLLHDLLIGNDNIQFLIATHSPILLAYPGAQILSFDGGEVHPISYRESQPFQFMSRFVASPERYMNALFSEAHAGDI
jgi:predicted ATPase